MSEMELFEKIEDYLKNRLPEAERLAFEAEIAANPSLKNEVALHRDMMFAVDDHELELAQKAPSKDLLDLRDLMENAYQEWQKEPEDAPDVPDLPAELPRSNKKNWIRPTLLGLVLTALIGSVWWWNHQSKPAEPVVKEQPVQPDSLQPIAKTPSLPADNLKPSPATPPATIDYAAVAQNVYAESPYAPGVLMSDSGDDPVENPLPKASEAYDQQDFKTVVQSLQTLPKAGRTDALKLRAHAQFRLKRYTLAALDFEELAKSPANRVDAEWNLLLCYAAGLPKTKANYEAMLAKVSANNAQYKQKADALQKRLSYKK